ncbi:MAG: type II toxin-antitoxin system YhaV family toxin [Propylenella sp.]
MKPSKAKSTSEAAVVVNGWQLFAHPLLLDQLERLVAAVERDRRKRPDAFQGSANFKLLAALSKLLFETIPEDPTRPTYRQGKTLGEGRKHWFRAKFGGQRFRLFFRYGASAKIIVYAWVNDSDTLRTDGAKTDAYAVFAAMLKRGNPPDGWDDLLKASAGTSKRLRQASKTALCDSPL